MTQDNVLEAAGSVVINAKGNYVFSPGKTVALVGVEDLVVVETEDALLITTRHAFAGCGQGGEGTAGARRRETHLTMCVHEIPGEIWHGRLARRYRRRLYL